MTETKKEGWRGRVDENFDKNPCSSSFVVIFRAVNSILLLQEGYHSADSDPDDDDQKKKLR